MSGGRDVYEELCDEIDILKVRVEQLKEVNRTLRRAHWKTDKPCNAIVMILDEFARPRCENMEFIACRIADIIEQES